MREWLGWVGSMLWKWKIEILRVGVKEKNLMVDGVCEDQTRFTSCLMLYKRLGVGENLTLLIELRFFPLCGISTV